MITIPTTVLKHAMSVNVAAVVVAVVVVLVNF